MSIEDEVQRRMEEWADTIEGWARVGRALAGYARYGAESLDAFRKPEQEPEPDPRLRDANTRERLLFALSIIDDFTEAKRSADPHANVGEVWGLVMWIAQGDDGMDPDDPDAALGVELPVILRRLQAATESRPF